MNENRENLRELDVGVDLGYGVSVDGDTVRIRMTDTPSRRVVAELSIPLDVWGLLLASRTNQPGRMRVFALDDNYGKERIVRDLVVPGISTKTWDRRREIVVDWLLANRETDPDLAHDWIVDYDDPDGTTASTGFNFHRHDGGAGTYRFHAHRYAEVES